MPEYKIADAKTNLEINVLCPYCKSTYDYSGHLRKYLESDLRAIAIDVELRCKSIKCNGIFIVNEISY